MKFKSIRDLSLKVSSRSKLLTSAIALTLGMMASNPASAVTQSVYASQVTGPTGALWLPDINGGHLWIADHLQGFCRIDGSTININTCFSNSGNLSAGQPAFDPIRNRIYLPDLSKKGNAVFRLTYNPAGNGSITSPAIIDRSITRPTAVALATDGTLYIGSRKDNQIRRIINPWSNNTTTNDPTLRRVLQSAGQTSNGRQTMGLAVHNDALYVAETNTLTSIPNISAKNLDGSYECQGGCIASDTFSGVLQPQAVYSDGSTLWATDAVNLYKITASEDSVTSSIHATGFIFPTAIGAQLPSADAAGRVFVGDDVTAGANTNRGNIWVMSYN